MTNERRRFTRYRVKENVFAALNEPEVIVGQIKDLSLGAAAFEFIPETGENAALHGQYFLDIFTLGSSEKLLSFPCRVRFRKSSREVSRVFYPTVLSHVCVAEFRDLPNDQSRALLDFLMRYSVGYAA
ncbi:MAG: PilZ domain-containing protein [Deltaproteobacteria bacterium]|nr:PilZ domain-containing protein [Deltaproteobacteria bacterium]